MAYDECALVHVPFGEKHKKQLPFSYYAVNVTFSQTNRTTGRTESPKPYYSGKHKIYDYKEEVFIISIGWEFYELPCFAGKTVDTDISLRQKHVQKCILNKKPGNDIVLYKQFYIYYSQWY